ncbi:PREDICTED: protein asteroid homolog 1-like [Amphimedon queenslandica]|uniref:Asteroid domain-containing protein n=2 Tax=Amphimedon queenslandica TaxID=400682 RepID=A0AAN0IMB8_AMPQE|nr:PREDICTED: protein asteroid homolog 1-like [Amphimedon queenslandica]|eukprot:XP_011404572.1 PREDICTED: protein asteroid homolog 1-like [Amphimedon queenslandica]
MGIQGLTTLIKHHYPSRTWRTVTPRGKLVLDGKNVSEIVIDKNWLHGGQYGEPRDHFIRFFRRLSDSGIDPIVIFDGVDYNREKSDTKLHRKKEKVKKVFNAILEDRITDSVVPIFTDIVFCETLKELGVEFIFADGDADRDTARIANHYNCPVVANDSDYFIFNLKAGYIPLDCLYWDQQPVKAKLYERDQFAYKFYFDHNPDLIYLIPAIMGNDFMKRMKPRSLSGAIADASQKAKISGTEMKQDEKLDMLYYISTFDTVKDFMTHLSEVCQDSEICSIKKNYEKAKELYDVGEISMVDLRESKNLKTANGTLLPRFIRQEYRKGCFATSVMAVLVLNESTIPVMVDSPHDYTAMRIGEHIRKCIYMILSPYLSKPEVIETTFTHHMEDPHPREERVRWTDVRLNLPYIDDMQYLSKNERIEILCRVLETPFEVQMIFIKSELIWKLVAVSLHYWSQHAHPDIHLIEALVLCFIHCSFDETVCPSSDLPDYKRNKMWLEALHIFAQWKSTYYDAFRLNNVLMNPLPFMSPALLFNGKLIMHYACTREFIMHKRKILESSSAKTLFEKLMSVCT